MHQFTGKAPGDGTSPIHEPKRCCTRTSVRSPCSGAPIAASARMSAVPVPQRAIARVAPSRNVAAGQSSMGSSVRRLPRRPGHPHDSELPAQLMQERTRLGHSIDKPIPLPLRIVSSRDRKPSQVHGPVAGGSEPITVRPHPVHFSSRDIPGYYTL